VSAIPTISPVPPVAPKPAATPAEPKTKSRNDFADLLNNQPAQDTKAPAADPAQTAAASGDSTAAVDTTAATEDDKKAAKDPGKTLLDDLLDALTKLDAALQGDQPVDPALVDNVNGALSAFANYLGIDISNIDPSSLPAEGGSKAIDPTSLLGQLTQKAGDLSKLLGDTSELAGKLDALTQKLQSNGLSSETLAKLGFALEPEPLPAPELATPALKVPETSTITKTAEASAKPTEIAPAKAPEQAPAPSATEAHRKTEKSPDPGADVAVKKVDDKPKSETHAAAAKVDADADPQPAQLPGTSAVAKLEVVGGVRAVQAAYQAAPTQVNVPQLAFDIVRHVQAGNSKFHVRLDPPELGRIDVRMDVDKSGNVTTRLTVEKSETLDLLQRDQRSLEKALAQAGLEGSKTNLEFSLRQNPSSHRDQQGDGGGSPFASGPGTAANDDAAETATVTQYRGTASASGLNLFV